MLKASAFESEGYLPRHLAELCAISASLLLAEAQAFEDCLFAKLDMLEKHAPPERQRVAGETLLWLTALLNSSTVTWVALVSSPYTSWRLCRTLDNPHRGNCIDRFGLTRATFLHLAYFPQTWEPIVKASSGLLDFTFVAFLLTKRKLP